MGLQTEESSFPERQPECRVCQPIVVIIIKEKKHQVTALDHVAVHAHLSSPLLKLTRSTLGRLRLRPVTRYATDTMPTPESEAFLAKKPTVPPTFDGVDFDDSKRLRQAQDAIIREQWVQVMMGRLVREELSKCYYREGVNHLEKCGHLRERYLQMLEKHKVRGYLFEQKNYVGENKSMNA